MKLVTWNINSLNVRLPRLLGWLAVNTPDVVCLQETKLEDAKFPQIDIEAAGYKAHVFGQRTYNGVAILVREGLVAENVTMGLPEFEDQKRLIAATVNGVRIVCAYVPNGQSVGSDKYAYKLAWCKAVTTALRDALCEYPQLAFAGDMNIAPEPRDVHDPVAWQDSVLFSPPERAVFREWLDAGFDRQLPDVRPAAEHVQLVGLPDARVPEEPRIAHRPHPAVAGAREALHELHDRSKCAQGRTAFRPRAGRRGARVTAISLSPRRP